MRHELETLAMMVHSALATLHLLGAVYNFRKRNWDDTIIHSVVFAYDVHSAIRHARRLDGKKSLPDLHHSRFKLYGGNRKSHHNRGAEIPQNLSHRA